ncbi:lipid II:glycine glycyltransferase FemX [Salinibacterium sp. GXW1014]|uniref:lipid II:glycine glycyltransferase FemX n=1 Tax=Salinibacterium sp. GXW1014 TaxID=3377838 RepID=UPI00383AD6A7
MTQLGEQRFCVWDAADPGQEALWVEFWKTMPNTEVSAHPGYVKRFIEHGERALCAAMTTEKGERIMLPFVLRPIESLDGLGPLADICSPYGYGGPWTWGSEHHIPTVRFWQEFDTWARAHSVVSQFIRFSLDAGVEADFPGIVRARTNNIVVSLAPTEEFLWTGFEHKVRKNVNKARRSGITVSMDESGDSLDDFLRIYAETMRRRDADAGYYFPREFFEAINSELAGQYVYANALLDGEVVSTELVLVSGDTIYSFLGGTSEHAFKFRPNDLLKFEVMLWAKARGKSRFVLGGGASPGDGIERYKRCFAPTGVVEFRTGELIVAPDEFQKLVDRRKSDFSVADKAWPSQSDYFPAYRMPL